MSAMLELPEMLRIPDKLLPIIEQFNDFRYFLVDGGRGSGKTQAVARFLLYLADKKDIRIVCGREIQNAIEESVYTVLVDLVHNFNLNFTIGATKIEHRTTNTPIRFRGFREQGAINIKGMEGVDVLWIDEAQAITKQTLDVIIPTIRKDKAKIFFTMNRWLQNDPVYETFINRKDCLHININYFDNPFCSRALLNEAEECKRKSEIDYNHIWLGIPLEKNDNGLFSNSVINNATTLEVYNKVGIPRRVLAIDVARFGNDETVYTVIECYGAYRWEQITQVTRSKDDTMQTVGRAISMMQEFDVDITVVDEGGIGGGVIDRLTELNKRVASFDGAKKPKVGERYYNSRAEGYFEMKDLLDKGFLKIINDPMLIEQLISISFKFNSNGTRQIISKDEMRKNGLKSPDRADALMMAVSQIDAALDQSKDTVDRYPRYSPMDNDIENTRRELPQYASMA